MKIDLEKHISYKDIPGWFDFGHVYDFMLDHTQDDDIFVEVGSFMGKSFAYLLESAVVKGKKIQACSVDRFVITRDDDTDGGMPWGENARSWEETNVTSANPFPLLSIFQENMKKVVGNHLISQVIHKNSVEAAAMFADKSIQCIFIDASHLYHNVLADLKAWFPKLKETGIIAGHDWLGEGVQKAVIDFFKGKNIRYAKMQGNSWMVSRQELEKIFSFTAQIECSAYGNNEKDASAELAKMFFNIPGINEVYIYSNNQQPIQK